jgi:hypothetical protein
MNAVKNHVRETSNIVTEKIASVAEKQFSTSKVPTAQDAVKGNTVQVSTVSSHEGEVPPAGSNPVPPPPRKWKNRSPREGEIWYNTRMVKKLKPDSAPQKLIISMDIECYKEDNGKLVPIAIGFDARSETRIFLLDEHGPVDMFGRAFEALMLRRYHNACVYIHNLARFDGLYLLKYLEELGYRVKVRFKSKTLLLFMDV